MTPLLPPAISSPVENSIGFVLGGAATAYPFHVQQVLPAGFVSVLIGDAFGWGNRLVAVTDTQGNVYHVDSAVPAPGGGGSAYMASAVLAGPLVTTDKITIHADFGGWDSFYLLVIGWTDNVSVLDVAGAPQGAVYTQPTGASLSVSVTPSQAADLVIGLAAYQTTAADDPAWRHVTAVSDMDLDHVVVAYRLAADTSALTYDTTGDVAPDSLTYFGASAVCAYSPGGITPPPPGQSTVAIGAISQGIRERVPCVARTSTQRHE